jgi:thymidylate synthase (FAD)
MSVKLVSMTKSLIGEKELSAEELIVYIARVSNPENQLNTETADRLLAYLINKSHWSPFEMVDVTFEVNTSRAIAQQIIRHKSLSIQEFSTRYSNVLGVEDVELRAQGKTNRQSSEEVINPVIYEGLVGEVKANAMVDECVSYAFHVYDELIKAGVSRETARNVLPLATSTRLYLKGSLRSWIHYIQVRNTPESQKEHRRIALCINDILAKHFPNVWKALSQK